MPLVETALVVHGIGIGCGRCGTTMRSKAARIALAAAIRASALRRFAAVLVAEGRIATRFGTAFVRALFRAVVLVVPAFRRVVVFVARVLADPVFVDLVFGRALIARSPLLRFMTKRLAGDEVRAATVASRGAFG
jgi:hypothetical protein